MIKVIVAESEQDLQMLYEIRKKVFIDEQKVPYELEIDELEGKSIHFLAFYNGEEVGAGRLRNVEGLAKIERICVLAGHRHHNIGTEIMETIEKYALDNDFNESILEAQIHALSFYEKLGYTSYSEEFLDAGIVHRKMKKKLA